MKLTNADIYTEHTLTDEIRDYPSLRSACMAMSKIPNKDRDCILLCIGNWNLDYIKHDETFQSFYNRMMQLAKSI